jgi:hypothetical protein
MLFIHQQDGDAIGGFDGYQMSGHAFEQRIAIAQQARSAARRHADIGMDLMQSSEPRVVSQIRCMTRAEAMLQPGEPFERTRAVDILGIPVKHYAGF